MDSSSYHEIDTIKMEKQKAMQRYRTFKKIGNVVRTLEIVVAVTLVSYSISFTSSYLPAAVEFAGAIFRRLSNLLFSPHFVFLVGNVIIITLFAKSSRDQNNSTSENVGDEFSVATEENVVHHSPVVVVAEVPAVVEEKEEEKETEEKVYRRTKSTADMVVVKEAEKKELRRSETEVRRKTKSPRRGESGRFEVDELSNEEFRRKVEAFIEKQQRFLRDEKLAVVLSN